MDQEDSEPYRTVLEPDEANSTAISTSSDNGFISKSNTNINTNTNTQSSASASSPSDIFPINITEVGFRYKNGHLASGTWYEKDIRRKRWKYEVSFVLALIYAMGSVFTVCTLHVCAFQRKSHILSYRILSYRIISYPLLTEPS